MLWVSASFCSKRVLCAKFEVKFEVSRACFKFPSCRARRLRPFRQARFHSRLTSRWTGPLYTLLCLFSTIFVFFIQARVLTKGEKGALIPQLGAFEPQSLPVLQ